MLNTVRAIDTPRVASLIDKNGVVPMLADWSNRESPEGLLVKAALTKLGRNSIPLLVIFPASRPDEPVVLCDLLSESQVLAALKSAGPSTTNVTATRGTTER